MNDDIRTAIDEALARRKARYAELVPIDRAPRQLPKRNRRSSVKHRAIH